MPTMHRIYPPGRVGHVFRNGRHWTALAVLAFVSVVFAGDRARSAIPSPVILYASRPAPATQNLTADDRIARLRAWTDAVYQHRPGAADAPVLAILRWQQRELVSVLDDVRDLLSRLAAVYTRGRGAGNRLFVTLADASFTMQDVKSMLRLTEDEITHRDPTRFVKRAAILQMDAAIVIGTEGVAYQTRAPASDPSALIVANDGQSAGRVFVNEHWAFGRMLLKGVQPDPARDEMVRLWYCTAAAALHSQSAFGDLAIHLAAAQSLFRNDADLLFYNGAMHESFSGERIQTVVRELVTSKGARPNVPNADTERALAASFFEQALERNPDLVEARLRLGRVRGLQGRHDEAVSHLRLALAATGDTLLQYYGQLFLGREEVALGHRAQAQAAFERAAALYPRAQSPRLALSQLARAAGDRAGALASLRQVLRGPATTEDDPWWLYDTAAGRHMNALLAELCKPFLAGVDR
jgi:tetratricopeptide (TPR) repeat protein